MNYMADTSKRTIGARLADLSVGGKFVTLTVFLLLLMLITSVYAFTQTERVSEETRLLNDLLAPWSRQIDKIGEATADEALAMARAIRFSRPPVVETARAAEELARFETLRVEIIKNIDETRALIHTNESQARSADLAVAFARMELELDALKRDHARYVAAALVLVKLPVDAPQDHLAAAENEVTSQEVQVDATMDRLATETDEIDKAGEARLGSLGQRAYVVSANGLALAFIAFIAGSLLSFLLTRRIIERVRLLIRGTEQVSNGNLEVTLAATVRDEIGQLSTAFSAMVDQLRAKAAMRETISNYIDPRVVDRLLGDDRKTLEAGEKREMTVFFSDIEGFSKISETLTPTALVKLINRYLSLAADPIRAHQGVIDKYIGDAIMAYWGEPFTTGDHALNACRAALAQRQQIDALQLELPELLGLRKWTQLVNVRIGLATGDVVVGSIGSETSKSFTLMGDSVNIAARLEGANKAYGTHIIIDEMTLRRVHPAIEARELDLLAAMGKTEAVRIFELLGERGEVSAAKLEQRDAFEHALVAYRAGAWDTAARDFQKALAIDPDDAPSRIFLARIEGFRHTPPASDWGGIWQSLSK
jgi:class 3 adenylate cyclase